MQKRLTYLALIFLLFNVVLIVRLFYWQIIKASELSAQARFQHNSNVAISANRGSILSTDGAVLTASADAWLVYASKPELKIDTDAVALKLSSYFVNDPNDTQAIITEVNRLKNLLNQPNAIWIPLKHKVSSDAKRKIEDLDIAGVGFDKEEARVYPEASSAAQLIGFVGLDSDGNDKGYFGLEGYYDYTLTGKSGYISRESDAFGSPILFGDSKQVNATGGVNLVTYIDKRIQLLAEQKLGQGIAKYEAKAGSVVIMDPKTGGILAMTSFPSYDPGSYQDFSDELFKNPVISDSFEPGSIFKPLIMAAALDAKVITPETICDQCSGPAHVDKYSIETWNSQYFPNSSMTDIIIHSDNVGMVFVGNKLGKDRLYDYLSKFGIGSTTGIDLQGEAVPRMRDKSDWNIVDQATATFGQGIAVTPIQMLRAISIIANNGLDISPRVVKKLTKDNWSQNVSPETGQRVISQNAADDITIMMERAVSDGEAKWAAPKGYDIAGKTGTAQIPVAGHYDPTKTNASFIGFAPAHDPKFVMLVTLSEPGASPWAAETAAPLWFDISKELFAYMGIQPN